MPKPIRSFVMAAAALLIQASVATAQEIPPDPIYAERLAAFATPRDTVLDLTPLTPKEVVAGARGRPMRLTPDHRRRLSPSAAQAAIDLVRPLKTQALIVWRDGAIELEWYADGYDADTRSSTASMMKPLMAIAIGAAIKEGKIGSVDDPVGRYVQEWRDDPRGAITLRQLLQMRSGLAFSNSRAPTDWPLRLLLGSDVNGVALGVPLAGEPGAAFQYSNVNSQILGLALQRAVGVRYADWLSRSVWAPIGASEGAVWLDRDGGMPRTYCCMIATARDWVRVGVLLLREGRVGGRQLVPKSYVREMIAPSPANPNFGYQVWLASPHAPQRSYGPAIPVGVPAAEPFLAPDTVYFDGAGGQRVYVSKAEKLVIVRIGEATTAWDDSRLPNIVVAGLRVN